MKRERVTVIGARYPDILRFCERAARRFHNRANAAAQAIRQSPLYKELMQGDPAYVDDSQPAYDERGADGEDDSGA